MKGSGAKVLAGLMVLKSVKMARYVNGKIPGIFVPECLIVEFERSPRPIETGLEIGVHLMTLGLEERVPEILDRAGL